MIFLTSSVIYAEFFHEYILYQAIFGAVPMCAMMGLFIAMYSGFFVTLIVTNIFLILAQARIIAILITCVICVFSGILLTQVMF